MSETNKETSETGVVYELGLHIISSIPEENAKAVWEEVHALITKNKGEVISEEAPQIMDLAYTMEKRGQGKIVRYNSAYFGWVKFDMEPDAIADVKKVVEAHPQTLRSIIIKTVRESTMHGHKFPAEGARPARVAPAAPKAEAAPEATASEGEVDKAIDNLVTE
jgi:ribosomal protein S6